MEFANAVPATYNGVPAGAPLFSNCTVPVGAAPLLCVLIWIKQFRVVPTTIVEGMVQLLVVVGA